MILELMTAKTNKTIASDHKLYSHSALYVTVEMKSELNPGYSYHLTMAENDLLDLLLTLKRRQAEIKIINTNFEEIL